MLFPIHARSIRFFWYDPETRELSVTLRNGKSKRALDVEHTTIMRILANLTW